MIINWLSVTLVILTIILFCVFVASICALDFEIAMASLIVGIVFIGFLGWFGLGHAWPCKSFTREIPAKVTKLDTSIILTIDDIPIQTITSIPEYKFLSDKTNVTVLQSGSGDIYENTNWYQYYTVKY